MPEPANPSFAASLLRNSARGYASAVVGRFAAAPPEVLGGVWPEEFARPIDDTEVRVRHLAEAVAVARPSLFARATAWYKVAFHHRGVPSGYLPANLTWIGEVLRAELPPFAWSAVEPHLALAAATLPEAPVDLASHLATTAPHGDLAARFLLEVLEGRGDEAFALIRAALGGGVAIEDIHDHVLVPVQRETGRMWLCGEITVAEEHFGSAVVDRVLWLLHDRLPARRPGQPMVLTLGVGGDLHGIGLRIVAQRLRLAGFEVHDLGSNMPAEDIEWALRDRRVDLVAIAASMLLHLGALRRTVAQVRALAAMAGGGGSAGSAGSTGGRRLPVLVGGEPFAGEPELARELGADAGASTAAEAVAAARQLLGV